MDVMAHGPPLARKEQLLCREVPEGLMVFDLDRQQAHSLNQTAALVWRHCDGTTGVADLAALLQRELNLPAEETVVWLALDRLEKAHLLEGRLSRSAESAGLSRRAVIRKMGLAGGMVALLPLVDTLVAPRAAEAQSDTSDGTCAAADCSVCGQAGPHVKLCCSGPSNVPVCNPCNSANCGSCPNHC
jgi:hypothetical protein